MPSPLIKSFADKYNKSQGEIEKLWDKAKKSAEDQGKGDQYDYIVGILKNMLGEKMSLASKIIERHKAVLEASKAVKEISSKIRLAKSKKELDAISDEIDKLAHNDEMSFKDARLLNQSIDRKIDSIQESMDIKSIVDYLSNFADEDETPIDSLVDFGMKQNKAKELIDAWFKIKAMDRSNMNDSQLKSFIQKYK